jgi:hypothetical protein
MMNGHYAWLDQPLFEVRPMIMTYVGTNDGLIAWYMGSILFGIAREIGEDVFEDSAMNIV